MLNFNDFYQRIYNGNTIQRDDLVKTKNLSMKKITVSLLLLIFVLRVAGQQMNTQSLLKGYILNKSLNLKPNAGSRSIAGYDSSAWLCYGEAIGAIYGLSEASSAFLWPSIPMYMLIMTAAALLLV